MKGKHRHSFWRRKTTKKSKSLAKKNPSIEAPLLTKALLQSKTLLLFVADRLATLAVAVASQKVDFLKFVLKSLTEEKHTHTHGLLFVAYT